ncbi:MAG: protein translocase subunit SecD [Betaproteobacteria bacterium]
MNKYPAWKYVVITIALVVAFLYTLPNFYSTVPAVQVVGLRTAKVDAGTQKTVEDALKNAGVDVSSIALEGEVLRARFKDNGSQFHAREIIQKSVGRSFSVALSLVSNSPAWLTKINALPMYLGLDLQGGVHFLLQVNMKAAIEKTAERYAGDIRALLRDKKIFYTGVSREADRVTVKFKEQPDAARAQQEIISAFPDLQVRQAEANGEIILTAITKPETLRSFQDGVLQQNITALRKRVNELGVSEPIVQQQGPDRILVQLAGVHDPANAKEIIGRTASLEVRLVEEEHAVSRGKDAFARYRSEPAPFGTEKILDVDGYPVLVSKNVAFTGDRIADAQPGIEQQNGNGPIVNVTLDNAGGRAMTAITRGNVGKRMAIVMIEKDRPEVLTWPNISMELGARFYISGMPNTQEAKNLALLLRAGALAAPMEIIEERTIGPSLGADNIEKGKNSLLIGFALITSFMIAYYMLFGVISVTALACNLFFLVALLSMVQVTLTLPGIAAIALALGMAIDANVLINERIREELRNGMSPQMAIQAGYDRALDTIIDSNITTLIVGLALLIWGSGPVRGFAVVHCLGILTSAFSAVMVSRGLVNLIYGGRKKIDRLSIGNVAWHSRSGNEGLFAR